MKRLVFIIAAVLALNVSVYSENGENPVSAVYENMRMASFDAYSFGMGGATVGLGSAPANFLNSSGYAFSSGVDGFAGTGMYMNFDDADSYLIKNMYAGVTFPIKDWFVINISGMRSSYFIPQSGGDFIDSDIDDNFVDVAYLSVNRFTKFDTISLGFGFAGKYVMPTTADEYQFAAEDEYNKAAFGGDFSLIAKISMGQKGSFNMGLSVVDIVKPLDVATGFNAGASVEYKHQLAGDARFTVAFDYLMNHSESGAMRVGAEEWFADETVALRAGYMQNTFYTDGGALLEGVPTEAVYDGNGQITAGLGLKFSGMQFNAGYALKSDYTGSSMVFGLAYTGDVKKKITYKVTPQVELSAAYGSFSPNGDGQKDQIRIKVDSKDSDIIKKWEMVITDENGKTVREYNGKKGLPMYVTWDGKTKKGNTVSEGKYYALISVKDKYGNKGASGKFPMSVRTKVPEVNLSLSQEMLNPGKMMKIMVSTGEHIDLKRTTIYFKKGTETVHMIEFSGSRDYFEWDGVYADGTYPAEGDLLNVFAEITDMSDNMGKSMLVELPVGAAAEVEVKKPVISKEYPPIPAMFVAARVNYEENQAALSAADKEALSKVLKLMTENPGMRVRVEGHTDSQGTERDNMLLSKKRAEQVRKYLISSGISAERIEAKGFGESMPIDSNKTAKGRKNNRRVDVIIINR